ncbi:hypothetical protein [Streptomyces sp. NPDC093589]|uniref:hypothetical protein n=1 Tax=Streptomyces sp. NPDC093589 TaxID=3366043 RepID=UPI0037FFF517
MPSNAKYDVDWTDEDNPRIIHAQPGDDAMTLTEAQQALRDGLDEVEAARQSTEQGLENMFRRLDSPVTEK